LKKYVIIVAGGCGSRMKSNIHKQFLELDGKPILMHTINAFYQYDSEIAIIVVLPKSQFTLWEELCAAHKFTISHLKAPGGETRFDSVKAGLTMIAEDGLVAIHDGVRPFVSAKLIDQVFAVAEKSGNAVPCVISKDSVRLVNINDNKVIQRTDVRLIQTPQCFQSDLLKRAYDVQYSQNYTDDSSVVSVTGEKIFLVEGSYENIKITTALDLSLAELLIKQSGKKSQ
jgi:2-C-methyl-D-erythritol 4-phosphate cytidylyltransferase